MLLTFKLRGLKLLCIYDIQVYEISVLKSNVGFKHVYYFITVLQIRMGVFWKQIISIKCDKTNNSLNGSK